MPQKKKPLSIFLTSGSSAMDSKSSFLEWVLSLVVQGDKILETHSSPSVVISSIMPLVI